jgi:hypothetical protein
MSREYDAVRHVLTSPPIAARTAPYIHEDDFAGLWELVRRLDLGNFDRVVQALRMARGPRSWDYAA